MDGYENDTKKKPRLDHQPDKRDIDLYDFIFQSQNLTSFSFFSLFVDLTNPKREFPLWRRYS